MTDFLSAALEYAAQGFPVFPVKPHAKVPLNSNGVKGATTDAEKLRRFWRDFPGAWIGLAGGGPLRLVVIDIDVDETKGADGRASIAALEQLRDDLPRTRTIHTPRGGEHRYFTLPVQFDVSLVKNSASKLGPAIDVRATNGYVVAPPSDGYTVTDDSPLAELPASWAALLMPPVRVEPPVSLAPTGDGYAMAALKDAVNKISGADEGERNDTINRQAFGIAGLVAGGGLGESEAHAALVAAVECSSLPPAEAMRAFGSGWAAGLAKPRTIPEPKKRGRPPSPLRIVQPNEPIPEGEAWERSLRLSKKGTLRPDAGNALLLLVNAKQWTGTLGFCDFRDKTFWLRDAPEIAGLKSPKAGTVLEESHFSFVQHALAVLHGGAFARESVVHGIDAAAKHNRSHVLRDWLNSLVWDGTPRIGTWLEVYGKADSSSTTKDFGGWWLIGAVARALDPGCQHDCTLILEGKQGVRKSRAVRILGGEWYLGSLGNMMDKDAMQILRGKWIVELSELHALKGAAFERVKSFLTDQGDTFRPSFARLEVDRRRQCAFIGTTNEHRYLHDPTGARRFWPVAVGGFDTEALQRDRVQLWAEAVHHFRIGTHWWSDEDDPGIAEEQEKRYETDPWEEKIAVWADERNDFSAETILEECLKIPAADQDPQKKMRVGRVMSRLGWHHYQKMTNRVRSRIYRKNEELS